MSFEEPRVTLQVGFVAKSGWIIATERTQVDVDGAIRVSDETVKLVTNEEIACASSGDALSMIAAEQLVETSSQIDRNRTRRSLAIFGDNMWERYHNVCDPPFPEYYNRGLLIGFQEPRDLLWILNVGKRSHATPCPARKLAGDQRNPAAFFLKYYSRSASLEQLTLLATHIITIGAELNSAGVGRGLDIAVCEEGVENGVVRKLSESEVEELQQRSLEADRKISQLFHE